MEIIKNNRKCKCRLCYKWVTTKHKVKDVHFYHLSCYFNHAKRKIKHFTEMKNRLSRYKKHMVLENISDI